MDLKDAATLGGTSGKSEEVNTVEYDSVESVSVNDNTRRTLKNRHIQLIGIGGVVGTALFVQIGQALQAGGPASLFMAFAIWSTVIAAVTECMAEMVTWMPISSPFLRFADQFVDEALGFAASFNFFFFESLLVPFEMTAVQIIINFWTDAVPTWAWILILLVVYGLLNVFAVKYYGESEFWLAIGKAVLAVGLIAFTFVTMVGGNPLHDVYGFRNWDPSKVSGAPFAEFIRSGNIGKFMGFLACFIQASFTIAGPEYVSMTAGEAVYPRKNLPGAFRSLFYRLTFFFVGGTFCVGTIVAYNDPSLLNAIATGAPGAAGSPYVIAMVRMGIPVLPHIVNALILTAVFSAGNSYVFIASRTLYGMALSGKVPKQLRYCTKNGVPVFCVVIVQIISCLSFLQLSNNSVVVLDWFINLGTASQLINFVIICITYLRFRKALEVQGISRDSLPYKARWQPYAVWYALIMTFIMTFVQGYTVFINWSIQTFFFSYAMVGVVPIFYVGWKLLKGTKIRRLEEIDFFSSERRAVDLYEASLQDSVEMSFGVKGAARSVFSAVRRRKGAAVNEAPASDQRHSDYLDDQKA